MRTTRLPWLRRKAGDKNVDILLFSTFTSRQIAQLCSAGKGGRGLKMLAFRVYAKAFEDSLRLRAQLHAFGKT